MDSAVLQHDLQELHDNKRTWARLAPVAKIHYLREIRDLVMANADGWVSAGAELKGLTSDSPVVAEEWLSGPYPTVTWLNDVIETLTAIDRGEDPLAGFKVRTTTSRADRGPGAAAHDLRPALAQRVRTRRLDGTGRDRRQRPAGRVLQADRSRWAG
ncbi:MAG: hypothetical protein V9G10_01270 [Candidatus Nanopelagicales bacterium]